MNYFTIKRAANGVQFYWTLTAPNNEVIATSEMYWTKAGAEAGIRSVKTWAPTAQVRSV